MTKAVSGGMGVAEVGTGLGALPLLGKKAARTPSAHHPLIPREQVLDVSWLPARLHFLLHLTEAPSQRPGQALGEKLGGGGGEDGDKPVHCPLLSPPSSLACTCQGLPEFPQGLGLRTSKPGLGAQTHLCVAGLGTPRSPLL